MKNKIDPNTGLLARSDDNEKIIGYENFTRIDILCGNPFRPSKFPCEKCKSEQCEGKGKCKGFGTWSYGISMK